MAAPKQQILRVDASATPLKRRATLADVAQMSGVSRSVAGHVLNGGGGNSRVSEATRKRVLRAARFLNYRSNLAARQLSGKRSHTFGLMVASAGDPLRSFLVEYLDAAALRIGCQVIIGNTVGNPEVGPDQFERYVDEFSRRGVDGVLCAVHRWWPGDRLALLNSQPHTVFYEDPGIEGACHVSVDRSAAVQLAVRHLVERGRKRIGLALMGLSRSTQIARVRGYETELAVQGLAVEPQLIFSGESFGLAYARVNAATGKWEFPLEVIDRAIDALVRDAAADAIVAYDDFWAAAMLRRLRARGVRVPSDVAIVGYLNHYLCDWTDPPLTSIDLRHDLAARAMIEMLERMVVGGPIPEPDRVVKIGPRLIVRESS